MKKFPRIAILMCTYNGEKYLAEQLDSIQTQTYKNWTLYVNDDGSKDNTVDILKSYQKKWGTKKLIIRRGPQNGFCQNFLQLINDSKIEADFYFLSDQDDVWMPNKLSHAIKKISTLNPFKPNLYCARTTYVSSDCKKILGQSELFLKPPSFKNAIVQCVAGGNTMAFNHHLKRFLQRHPKVEVVSHDWWLYIINELVGGETFIDFEPTIFYRQHNKSLIGANTGLLAKLNRLRMLLNGTYRLYNTKHLKALVNFHYEATNSNIGLIRKFSNLRDKPLRCRCKMIRELGIYRQTKIGHMALYLAALLKKL